MLTTNSNHLSAAFAGVLQRQAFLFAEPASMQSLGDPEAGWVHAHITFSGPICGRFDLDLAGELRREIAASVLGLESDDEAAERSGDDALKELLNVICGNLLTTMAGDAAVFDLGLPEVSAATETRPAISPQAMAFDVEGHPMALHLTYTTSH
jgi:CheY-specific phosphatase CheX